MSDSAVATAVCQTVSVLRSMHVCCSEELGVMREDMLVKDCALCMELVMSTDLVFVDSTWQLRRRTMYKTNSGVCFLVASTLLPQSCGFKHTGMSNPRSWTF